MGAADWFKGYDCIHTQAVGVDRKKKKDYQMGDYLW